MGPDHCVSGLFCPVTLRRGEDTLGGNKAEMSSVTEMITSGHRRRASDTHTHTLVGTVTLISAVLSRHSSWTRTNESFWRSVVGVMGIGGESTVKMEIELYTSFSNSSSNDHLLIPLPKCGDSRLSFMTAYRYIREPLPYNSTASVTDCSLVPAPFRTHCNLCNSIIIAFRWWSCRRRYMLHFLPFFILCLHIYASTDNRCVSFCSF